MRCYAFTGIEVSFKGKCHVFFLHLCLYKTRNNDKHKVQFIHLYVIDL